MTASPKEGSPPLVETTPTAAPTSFEMTIEEFCTRQSRAGVGPEMLGGFFASERAAGARTKATEDEFAARLTAFANAPA